MKHSEQILYTQNLKIYVSDMASFIE